MIEEAINYVEEFFVRNRPIALCYGEGFYVLLDGVKLLCYVYDVVLTQDSCNSLITGIGFDNGLQRAIQCRKDRGGLESSSQLVEGLLLLLSTTESYILSELDEGA